MLKIFEKRMTNLSGFGDNSVLEPRTRAVGTPEIHATLSSHGPTAPERCLISPDFRLGPKLIA